MLKVFNTIVITILLVCCAVKFTSSLPDIKQNYLYIISKSL